ncbi:MAG: zinc ribbon domain-containing protein YjdM [Pseudoxanthomonas sp.]
MSDFPACPQCGCEDTYRDGRLLVCPICAHEWAEGEVAEEEAGLVVRDSNGKALGDGDSVVVIKDLPVKGGSGPIKQGTVIRDIRLVEDDPTHIYDRKSGIYVKTQFLRRQ